MQLYIETSVEIIWAILIVIWVAAAFTSKKSIRRQSMGSRLTMILVAFICGFGLSQAAIYGHFLLARWTMGSGITSVIGLVMTIFGGALALWARFRLGRNWSGIVTIKEDHELIQTGPYRFVRHPIYSGILLLALGTAIVFGRVIFLIDAGIILGLLFWKSRIEDRFLAAHFGEAFENYRRRVAALIPWLF